MTAPSIRVAHNGGDVAVHKLRTVKIRLDGDTLRQHLLHFLNALLKLLGHNVGVGSFKHHGDASHALAVTIDCHRSEAFGRTEAHTAYVAYVYRYSAAVCYHNLFDVFKIVYHTLRADVIGAVGLLYITASSVLVVAAERLENLTYGDVE